MRKSFLVLSVILLINGVNLFGAHNISEDAIDTVGPEGIPDPEFSPYHRAVLEFIALRERYQETAR